MSDYSMPSTPMSRAELAGRSSRWWLFMLLGVASVVLGAFLLFDLVAAVDTLALLVAFGLWFNGLGELLGAGRYRGGWSIAAGVFLVVGGIVAVSWPGITLWALAVVIGVDLLLSGGVRVAGALADRPDGWGWLLTGGVLSLIVGVLAIAWPGATVLVLAIILGIRLIMFGAAEIAFAWALRDLRAAT
jgi:uncharacterized membrane protein HdeD (DUF308 family)